MQDVYKRQSEYLMNTILYTVNIYQIMKNLLFAQISSLFYGIQFLKSKQLEIK